MTTPALLAANNALSNNAMTSASTTYYIAIGNSSMNGSSTAESSNQTTERTSATTSKVYACLAVNSRLTASTVRFRKNTANGTGSVSVPGSTTGIFEDASGTDSLVAGDLFNISYTTGSGSAAQTLASFGCQYDSASDVYTHFRATQDGFAPTTTGVSATSHFNIAGNWSTIWQSADTDVKFPCRAPGDFSYFYMNCSANTRTAAMTAGIRKTGSAGNNSVSVPGTTTGTFEDVTPHTDTVTNTDKISGYVTTGSDSSHSATWEYGGVLFKGTGGKTDLVCHTSNAKTRGTTSDTYTHLTGAFISTTSTTVANAQDVVPFICRLSNLRATGQIINSTCTVKLQINGVDGNQSISVVGSGVTEDATSHDDTAANDKINSVTRSVASTSSSWDGLAITMGTVPVITTGSGSGVIQLTN